MVRVIGIALGPGASVRGQSEQKMTSKSNPRPAGLIAVRLLFLCLPLLLISPVKAYGYADPGTGAFIYQAVYAAFLGGMFYFRRLLDRIWRKRGKS